MIIKTNVPEKQKKEDTLNSLRISSEETFWTDVQNTRSSRTINEYYNLLKYLDIGYFYVITLIIKYLRIEDLGSFPMFEYPHVHSPPLNLTNYYA